MRQWNKDDDPGKGSTHCGPAKLLAARVLDPEANGADMGIVTKIRMQALDAEWHILMHTVKDVILAPAPLAVSLRENEGG